MNTISRRLWIYIILCLVSLLTALFYNNSTFSKTGFDPSQIGNGFQKGIDIAGGVQLEYLIDFDKYKTIYAPNSVDYTTAITNAKRIITNQISKRVNELGVGDAEIKIENRGSQDYVVVKIGGVSDIEFAKSKIGKTVELEFKTYNKANTPEQLSERKQYAQAMFDTVSADPDNFYAYATGKTAEDIYYAYGMIDDNNIPSWLQNDYSQIIKIKTGSVYNKIIEGSIGTGVDLNNQPIDQRGYFIIKHYDAIDVTGQNTTGVQKGNVIEYVFIDMKQNRIPAQSNGKVLNGAYFKQATVTRDQFGKPAINIAFDTEGQNIFCDVTTANVGNNIAIFVGGELVTSPVVQQKICGGNAMVNGDYTEEQAKLLASDLNEGALPAQLILANENKIDATLGADARNGAIMATLVGFIAIFLFMLFLFGFRQAVIAAISLIAFLSVLMAIVKLTGYALSLSGISAIILNIGMGVDAAILIFERFKEEYKGGNVGQAINIAYDRSRPAIRDGQLSTLAMGLLLFLIGLDVFKGFGLMMVINIILILVISVPLIKELLILFYDKKSK